MNARAFVLLALVGCGDNLELDTELAAHSGSRLKLVQYRYQDGTLQADTTAFYDTWLHAACTPRRWADDTLRCTPAAEEVRYADDQCITAVGMATDPPIRPTHFVGYDTVADGTVGTELRPARMYRVASTTDAISTYYIFRDDECRGPFPASATDYYALSALVPSDVLVFTDRELGASRLGLQVRETSDGMQVPLGNYDRELDLPCTPTLTADGVACEPNDAVAAIDFVDPTCTQPVLHVATLAEVPRVATVVDPLGCPRYHAVADELRADVQLYRRDGELCKRAPVQLGRRVFAVGAPLPLAQLERTVEPAPKRRLQQVVLAPVDDPALRFIGARLVDTATRSECERTSAGDVTWCLPVNMTPVLTLYATGCTVPVEVAELPAQMCRPSAFASRLSFEGEDEGFDVFAIGDPVTMPLYHYTQAGCVAYVPASGKVLHALGPKLPPETFLRAVKFGERAP